MTFCKGDPNINRQGRNRDSKKWMLEEALKLEGEKLGTTPFKKIAEEFYKDKQVMIAVLKKFVPDMTTTELEGVFKFIKMPLIAIEQQNVIPAIGVEIDITCPGDITDPIQAESNPDGDQ
jgi:hypothetical protein